MFFFTCDSRPWPRFIPRAGGRWCVCAKEYRKEKDGGESPIQSRSVCVLRYDFFTSQSSGFLWRKRERKRERGRDRGEAEYIGSQASGSTYRMSVVSIHTAGHESSHTPSEMWTPSYIPTSALQTDNRGTHTECKTSDLFFFTHPHLNIAGVRYEDTLRLVYMRTHTNNHLIRSLFVLDVYFWKILKLIEKIFVWANTAFVGCVLHDLSLIGDEGRSSNIDLFVVSRKPPAEGCKWWWWFRGGLCCFMSHAQISEVAPSAGSCQQIS